MKVLNKFWFALIGLAGLALAATGTAHARSAETTDPVKLPIMQSSDFDFIVTVYGEVLKEAGYRVEYVNADYSASFVGVKLGDLHITMGWDTTPEVTADLMSSGKAINAGSSGVAIEEGWWYPSYLVDSCPGLPDWQAFKDPACIEALSTAETAPMGRFVGVPSGWVANTEERIEAFQLEIENVSSGSPVTMAATIQGAIQRHEPVIGWGYLPHWLMAQNDGAFVAFPPYEAACIDDPSWGMTDLPYDCGFSQGYVWKYINMEFAEKAPFALRILYLMNIDETAVGLGMSRVDNDGMSLIDAARAWMGANEAVWQLWIL